MPVAMVLPGAPEVLKKPMTSLSQAQQELKALRAQGKALEEQGQQVDLQQEIAETKRQLAEKQQQIDEKQKKLEVASLPTYSAPKDVGREITGKDGAPMRLVPEGEFLYGDNNQRLSVPSFYLDKYEVTTALYAKHMGATGAIAPKYWPTSVLVSHSQKPVVGVSWQEAEAYCRVYGKRLPTEQEWEKAARGTDGRRYPWGNDEPTSRHAKYDEDGKATWDGYATLATVESYEVGQSPYGLYHMAGNVWEWTSSDYVAKPAQRSSASDDLNRALEEELKKIKPFQPAAKLDFPRESKPSEAPAKSVTQPQADGNSKVIRGGSWVRLANYLVSAYRGRGIPSYRGNGLGFRCAQDRPN